MLRLRVQSARASSDTRARTAGVVAPPTADLRGGEPGVSDPRTTRVVAAACATHPSRAVLPRIAPLLALSLVIEAVEPGARLCLRRGRQRRARAGQYDLDRAPHSPPPTARGSWRSQASMRVLLLHDYGTLNGGAEVMIVALRDALRKRGHDARLFTSTARPLPLPIVSDDAATARSTPLRRVLQAANPHARHAPAAGVARLQARRRARQDVPDAALATRSCRCCGRWPSLLHVINYNLICPINTKTLPDGTPCHHPPGRRVSPNGCMSWPGVVRALVQRQLRRRSMCSTGLSPTARWSPRRLRAEGVRVDAIGPQRRAGAAAAPARFPSGQLVGYAGRLVRKKGVDVLLHAMALLRQRVPGVRLIVVGDGPERLALATAC